MSIQFTFEELKELIIASVNYVPLGQTVLWILLIIFLLILFIFHLYGILSALKKRLNQGAIIKIGDVEIGGVEFNTSTADAEKSHKDLKIYGNPDQLKLLFKASTSTWSNSTKALETHNGCLIQVTNEQKQVDGSWIAAEALTFIPNVVVKDLPDGKGRYLAPRYEDQRNDIP